MATMTWLLATHNKGKIGELRRILAEQPIEIVGLDDLNITEESPESGDSFIENAMQKAAFYHDLSGLPALADDSGLEVDALNGAPGIHTARFGGYPTHAEKIAYLLRLMDEVPEPMRTARFTCAAVFYDGRHYISVQESLEGYVGRAPVGDGGFGYDPIFTPEPGGPTLAQFDPVEKNRISHRGKAFRTLVDRLLDSSSR